MTRLTSDPNDPEIERGGADTSPREQSKAYLILSEEERAKGFVRPVRQSYKHVGRPGPASGLRDLTEEERTRYADYGYVKYEEYPEDSHVLGRFWTQEMLDKINNGCQVVTKMSLPLAETYARQPDFYGATFCYGCSMHLPVGADGEFVWDGTEERVGT